MNFAANPVTINGSISGPNPITFAAITLNSDTLTIGGTKDITFTTNYDMSSIGTYTFDANTSVVGDAKSFNDAMSSTNVVITSLTAGTVAAIENSYWKLTGPPTLNTTASGGDIQWMYSTVSNAGPWTNVGANSTSYTHSSLITTSTYFMATVSCNSTTISAGDTVGVIVPIVSSTTPATRCGTGNVNLGVTGGVGNIFNWYTSSTSGVPVATGNTFTTPTISTTTNYYVAASTDGGGLSATGLSAPVAGTSGAGTTNFGIVFDALSPFTLSQVTIYPVSATSASGTVVIDVINSAGTVLNTMSVPVVGSPGGAVGQVVTLNFNIAVGTNLKIRPGSFTGITGLLFGAAAAAPPGGNYGYPMVIPGVVSLNSSTLTAAPTNTARNDLYYYFYDWKVVTGCETARQLVTATITPAPTLSLSAANANICSGSSNTSLVNITSTINDFDTYTWTPSSGVSGSAATGFTFSPSVATSYVLNASQSSGQQCVNSANLSVTLDPLTAGTVTSSKTEFCGSVGNPTLSTTAIGGNYQWYESTISRNGPWTPVGINANSYTPSTPVTSTTFYRATVTCDASTIEAGDTISYIVPVLVSTTPGSRCGAGTVSLSAAGGVSNEINWYAASTGGAPIASGTSFVTPSISTTTNYYAAASSGGYSAGLGLANRVGTTQNTGYADVGLMFNAIVPFTLTSVNMYPVNATPGTATMTIQLRNSAGTTLQTTTVNVATTPAPGVKTLIPLNFTVPAGTGHRLVITAATGLTGLTREVTTGYTYPYDLPGIASITSAYTGGASSAYYYYFYDWLIGTGCESARQLVTATVNPIPTAPNAPSTVSKTGSSIDVTWNSVSGATAYQLDVATDALFSSMVSGYNSLALLDTFNSITGLSGGTSYFIRIRSVNASSCASVNSSTLNDTTSSSNVNVALTAFLQGIYTGGSTMTSTPFNADGVTSNTIADTITVELYNAIGTLAFSSVGTINVSGLANISFPSAAIGGSYYILVKHRNSIATSSATTVAITSVGTSYNFSTAATQAYGDNMTSDGNGVYLIYTGDINQDGSVDFNDYPNLDVASSSGVLGYDPNDLNGDASVDFNDYPLIDVNSSNGIISSLPF